MPKSGYQDKARPVDDPPQLYLIDYSTSIKHKEPIDLKIRPFPNSNWDNVGIYHLKLEASLEDYP